MLYKEALGKDFQEPKEWELREINNIMNKSITGWQKHPTSDSKIRFEVYGKQRAWDRVDEHGFRQRVPEKEVPEDFVQLDMADMEDDRKNRPCTFGEYKGRYSYQVWKCEPAARYLIYGVGQQSKGLLSAGHGYLQIINQGSFQKPGIVYLLFFCNPF